MSNKTRLDVLLVEQGHMESRQKAQAVIMAGSVFVDGQRVDKPGTAVPNTAQIEVRGHALPYVSRGGLKLEKAMKTFPLTLTGKVCADIGASTGGFTDCMLQNGAQKVYAVDVGYGQLDWKLRGDPRVVCMERTNARYLTHEQIPQELDFASVDVSFISLGLILPALDGLLSPEGEAVCLVKPQFEAGREKVGKKGGAGGVSAPCEGKPLYSAWNYLFPHPGTGGEYRISGLSSSRAGNPRRLLSVGDRGGVPQPIEGLR